MPCSGERVINSIFTWFTPRPFLFQLSGSFTWSTLQSNCYWAVHVQIISFTTISWSSPLMLRVPCSSSLRIKPWFESNCKSGRNYFMHDCKPCQDKLLLGSKHRCLYKILSFFDLQCPLNKDRTSVFFIFVLFFFATERSLNISLYSILISYSTTTVVFRTDSNQH